jgi:molybdopterin synthase catalytic subunit
LGFSQVKTELVISEEPINEAALVSRRNPSKDMGAVLSFSGVVRGQEEGQPIAAINYETFREMAEHQFFQIFKQVEKNWPIESIRLVHRIGMVPVGEPSLWVEVMAPHRKEAFAACQFLIDEMKRLVPIWKRPVRP